MDAAQSLRLLLAALMVMLMHVGFAMVAVGLGRAKNASHTVAMNLMIVPLTGLAFWVCGFGIGWGNLLHGPGLPFVLYGKGIAVMRPLVTDKALAEKAIDRLNAGWGLGSVKDSTGKETGEYTYGLCGARGFCLAGIEQSVTLSVFFFMMVLAQTAASIPIGAMAERWQWKNFCLFGLWFVMPYALFANWCWGGGWLAQAGRNWQLGHGMIDLAGSGVIHAMGGLTALVGCWIIGPRTGKYRGLRPQPLPGHHVPQVVLGSLIMAVGWPALNAACPTTGGGLSLGLIIVNTSLAGFAAALSAMLMLWFKQMRPDPTLLCNGLLAGLVAISAGCGFVETWAAIVIGAVAGSLVVIGVLFFERYGLDDPVGVISVHGLSGLWGLIAVGLFASGKYGVGCNGVWRERFVTDGVRGLFYGDPSQLLIQLLGAVVLVLFGLGAAWLGFTLSARFATLRVGATWS
jgi:Amt family ammonium transporter